ncbi:MAG: O-antigen ligase family protein, partial [Candidatus Baltobacteraceae bacterium]
MIPDPLSLLVFMAFFAAVTLATMRRPAYGVCALAISCPFALYQVLAGTTLTLLKASLFAVALGMLAYRGAFRTLLERSSLRFVAVGAAIFGATLLSILQAHYPAEAVRESFKAVEYLAVFSMGYICYRADPDRALLRTTAVALTLTVCALALTQEFYGAHSVLLMNGHPTPRIAGPLEGPNQLAGYLEIGLPLLLAFALTMPTPGVGIALFALALTDVLTFSRGGAIGAAAAMLAVFFAIRGSKLRVAFPLAGGAICGAAIASFWGHLAHTIGLSRFWDLRPSAYGGGVGTRPLLWRAAIELWRSHPLFGIGAGNFEDEVSVTGIPAIHTHANSLYLQSLVEGGIPLFAANVAALAVAVMTFARRAARSPVAAG